MYYILHHNHVFNFQIFIPTESGFELLDTNRFWPDLFKQYFLNGGTSPDDSRDDMLFYIIKKPEMKNRHGIIVVSSLFKN